MTLSRRTIAQIIEPEPVIEGAGVRLKRSIGTATLDYLDPFLLFDDFTSGNPSDYEAGFPLHPHRGIETVTYVLAGEVRHKDTLGNAGSITAGEIQWMTAGRGIMHEEMPQVRPEGIVGFQLWVNLPAKLKMTRPRYQDIRSGGIRELTRETGARIRVIAAMPQNITIGPRSARMAGTGHLLSPTIAVWRTTAKEVAGGVVSEVPSVSRERLGSTRSPRCTGGYLPVATTSRRCSRRRP